MSLPDPATVLGALRAPDESLDSATEPDSPVAILVRHAGAVLFERRLVAPREFCVRRALPTVRSQHEFESLAPEVVLDSFEREIIAEAHRYIAAPSDNLEEYDVSPHRYAFRRCMGVRDADADLLIKRFHEAPELRRLGIHLLLEKSSGFAYLREIIDVAPGEPKIEESESAMRAVLRTVWNE